MDFERIEKQLSFLREIDKAKSVFRNTLLLDTSRRENDAEHSWHMAICAMLFMEYLDEPITDMARLIKMILLHDVIEIYAGDTFLPYGNKELLATLHEREKLAADKIFGILPDDQSVEFRSLWDEFDKFTSPESKCAHLVDTFMPVYHSYITKGQKWREFNITKEIALKWAEYMRIGSEKIYQYVLGLLDDAENKGFFFTK